MNAQHFDILIIGAGLSGIGTACQLTAELPNKTIALLERRERAGRHLGPVPLPRHPVRLRHVHVRLQVPPMARKKVLADGASIRQYIADTATEYGVDKKIRYGPKIVSADWSTAERRWTVTASTRRR